MKHLTRKIGLCVLTGLMTVTAPPIWAAPIEKPSAAHWSFQRPVRPALPEPANRAWIRNSIDHFILARLEREGITPSPEADRRTLIRRLSLDLLGLPPSPEEIDRFVNDQRANAYEHLVDRLLSAPQFGERWARHWLDLARYADSDGYEKDSSRPYAYLFRDWVIRAINDDLPFDQFTIEQLAGDLLPNATHEQKVATGFHRNTLTNKEGGVDQEEFRCKATVDRVSTTGAVWLGLTLGCAECHNHKYDPITQREFYQFYAFFNNASEKDIPSPTPDELTRYNTEKRLWTEQRSKLQRDLAEYLETHVPAKQAEWESRVILPSHLWRVSRSDAATASERPIAGGDLPERIVGILEKPSGQRTAKQRDQLKAHFSSAVDPDAQRLKQLIAAQAKREPKFPETKAQTLVEQPGGRKTHVHIRGDFLRLGEEVEPGAPAVLHPLTTEHATCDASTASEKTFSPASQSSQANRSSILPTGHNRLALARWLFDAANPLTARVTANRTWYHLFGRGLVATLDDFGTRGEKPTHPDLLDWLATEFQRLGWSRKALIKLIVTSATYRQSSTVRQDLMERDPNNLLLARQNRIRLEAETIRDSYLAVSGLLAPAIGGPSIRPPLPADIAALGYANSVKWQENQGTDRYRRGLYVFFQRTVPYPMLMMFDAPDSNATCTRRERSNTPLQALTLLNDPVFFECAQALGRRMAQGPLTTSREQICRGFELSLARRPTDPELERLEQLYEQSLRLIRADGAIAGKLAKPAGPATAPLEEIAALIAVSRTILNLDEFVTRE